jgi:hypothetical protein
MDDLKDLNELKNFVKIDISEEKSTSPMISLRISDRLRKTIIKSNKQLYIRQAIQILYLLRLSPYRNQILQHLGYTDDFNFNFDMFLKNYTNGYFPSLFANSISQPQLSSNNNENNEKIVNELQKAKEKLDMAIKVAKIYKNVFVNVQNKYKKKMESNPNDKANTPMTFNEYKTVFPTKEEIDTITKFFELIEKGDK